MSSFSLQIPVDSTNNTEENTENTHVTNQATNEIHSTREDLIEAHVADKCYSEELSDDSQTLHEFSKKSSSTEETLSSQTVNTLVSLFMSGSMEELNDLVKKYFTNLKQGPFTNLLTKKTYGKTHRNKYLSAGGDAAEYVPPTEMDRYTDLMNTIVETLKDSSVCDKYLSNQSEYFNEMKTVFCSDDGYDLFEKDFLSGSFKGIGQQLARIFNCDKADTIEGIDGLSQYVKQYEVDSETTPGFDTTLRSEKGLYMYMRIDTSKDPSSETDEEREGFINSLAFPIFDSGINTLCFYENKTSGTFTSYWITNHELGEHYQKVTCEDVLLALTKSSYTIGNVHFTDLATVKRNYMAKNFDTLRHNSYILKTVKATYKEKDSKFKIIPSDIHFYSGAYKSSSDMNGISEMNISNAVMGFPQSFGDLSNDTFAVFTFEGEIGNISVNSYWMMTQPKEALLTKLKNVKEPQEGFVLSQDDEDAFEWNEIGIDEFSEKIQIKGSVGTSCLH